MKIGRNDLCPCGSGRKYKQCCLLKESVKSLATINDGNEIHSGQIAKYTARRANKAIPPQNAVQDIVSLFGSGRYAEVEELAKTLVKEFPNWAPGWRALGGAMKIQGKGGLAELRQAVELDPGDAEGHNNLGTTLHDTNHLVEAKAHLCKAVALNPAYAEAHYNLGRLLKDTGELDAALESYRRSIKLKPGFVEAHHESGLVLQRQGRFDEALSCHQRAIELNPSHAYAHNAIGAILLNKGQIALAEASIQRALEINPDCAEAYNNLGQIFQDQFRLSDSVRSYRKAVQLKPDDATTYSNLLFNLNSIGELEIDAEMLFAEHCRFGELFEAPLREKWPQHSNSRIPERCLQVGIVSGDLRGHAVARVIMPTLANLSNYPQLSLHAYYNHFTEDAYTQRMREYFKHWHPISGLPDAAVAERIRADGIDILIDLSGHSAFNRLLTFARKPAPVQVSWTGYPGTTGLLAMDYYLADRLFLPHDQFANQFTEKIVYLPAMQTFMPLNAPLVNELPAWKNGYVTWGSFNRQNKISQSVIALWAKLLRVLPDSKMLLGGMSEGEKYSKLIEWFAQEGIAQDRLSFHGRSGMDQLHHQVDICLDTFPYSGSTTTLHALWMGVPTITLAGNTPVGRLGAAALGNVGLETFIVHNEKDFVQKGVSWASNLVALSEIRMGMRERFVKSPVGQPDLIAAGLERALRIMWQRWCAGLPAESFEVTQQELSKTTRETIK